MILGQRKFKVLAHILIDENYTLHQVLLEGERPKDVNLVKMVLGLTPDLVKVFLLVFGVRDSFFECKLKELVVSNSVGPLILPKEMV